MTVDEILRYLDQEGSTGADLSPGDDRARDAAALIRRWQAGDFTKEEIHNFCHKLPETVSACEFAAGCAEYQRKIYGRAPHADDLAAVDRVLRSYTEYD